ncbi:MAG: hypothetical protein R3B09_29555 [Nannocystaceae bacterium]
MSTTRRVSLVIATIALGFSLPACSFSYSSSSGKGTAQPGSSGGKPIHSSSSSSKPAGPSKATPSTGPSKAVTKADNSTPPSETPIPKAEPTDTPTAAPTTKPASATAITSRTAGPQDPKPGDTSGDTPNQSDFTAKTKKEEAPKRVGR